MGVCTVHMHIIVYVRCTYIEENLKVFWTRLYYWKQKARQQTEIIGVVKSYPTHVIEISSKSFDIFWPFLVYYTFRHTRICIHSISLIAFPTLLCTKNANKQKKIQWQIFYHSEKKGKGESYTSSTRWSYQNDNKVWWGKRYTRLIS